MPSRYVSTDTPLSHPPSWARLAISVVAIATVAVPLPNGWAAPGPPSDESSKLFERQRQYEDHLEHKALRLSELQAIAIRREWVPTILGENDSPGLVGIETTRSNNEIFYDRYLLPEVQLQWTFFDPSRTPRTKASLASLQASRLLFDISARNLILNIQQSYAELQKQRDLEKSYSELAKLTYALVRVAQEKGSNSDSSESERGQLAAEELDLLIFKINSHEQVIRQAAELARLLSLPPGDLALPSDPLRQRGRWDLSLKQTIDQALALRE